MSLPAGVAAEPGSGPVRFDGWRVVSALAVSQAFSLGLLSIYGIVLEPIRADFGLALQEMGLGMAVFILMMAMTGPILGPIVDRRPVRPLMLAGVVTMSAGIALLSRASGGGGLALGMAVAALGVACFGPLPVNAIIVNWFVEHRGTALAISAAGPSIGGLALPLLTAWWVETRGWREAMLMLAGLAGAIAFAAVALFVVKRPEEVGQHPDGRPEAPPVSATEAAAEDSPRAWLGRLDFWLLGIGYALLFCVPVATGLFFVPFLEERGIDRQSAAIAASLTAIFGLVGSLLAGSLADRINPKGVLIGFQVVHALAFARVVSASSYSAFLVGAAGVGLGLGSAIPLHGLLVARIFGSNLVGRVLGVQGAIGFPFLLAAAPLAGWLADREGSRSVVFVAATGVLAVAIVLLAGLGKGALAGPRERTLHSA